jgi:cell division septal protein FtsQ
VCGLAALAGAVWRAPALRVSHATVVGNRRLSAQSIYAAAALDGRHILAIDYRRAERAIGDLGGVATARVRPHPPGGIRIVVSETPLVVAWLARDASAAVDAEGSVVALSSADGLLRVTSNSPMPLDDAGRIPADVLDAALAYGQRFGDLAYDPATGFAARLPEGATLRLGTEARRLPQQLAMLDAMLARIPVGTQSVETIDLRFPNRPYYRTAEGAP